MQAAPSSPPYCSYNRYEACNTALMHDSCSPQHASAPCGKGRGRRGTWICQRGLAGACGCAQSLTLRVWASITGPTYRYVPCQLRYVLLLRPACALPLQDGSVLVGDEAVRAAESDPANVLYGIKRLMGRSYRYDDGCRSRSRSRRPLTSVSTEPAAGTQHVVNMQLSCPLTLNRQVGPSPSASRSSAVRRSSSMSCRQYELANLPRPSLTGRPLRRRHTTTAPPPPPPPAAPPAPPASTWRHS